MQKYKANVRLVKGDEVYEFDATIEDIRYDKDFDPENVIPYIVAFYAKRFSGKRDSWKLAGISVEDMNEGA